MGQTLVDSVQNLRSAEHLFDDLSLLQDDAANIEAIVASHSDLQVKTRIQSELDVLSHQIVGDMELLIEVSHNAERRREIQRRIESARVRLTRYGEEARPTRAASHVIGVAAPQGPAPIESVERIRDLGADVIYSVPREQQTFPHRIRFNATLAERIRGYSGEFGQRVLRALQKGVRPHRQRVEGIVRVTMSGSDPVDIYELKLVGPGGDIRYYGCLIGDVIEFVTFGDHGARVNTTVADRCRQMARGR